MSGPGLSLLGNKRISPPPATQGSVAQAGLFSPTPLQTAPLPHLRSSQAIASLALTENLGVLVEHTASSKGEISRLLTTYLL